MLFINFYILGVFQCQLYIHISFVSSMLMFSFLGRHIFNLCMHHFHPRPRPPRPHPVCRFSPKLCVINLIRKMGGQLLLRTLLNRLHLQAITRMTMNTTSAAATPAMSSVLLSSELRRSSGMYSI